jgi:hypothetical protein
VLATDASARGYGWILYRLEKTENRESGADAGMLLIDGHHSVLKEALLDVVLVISQDNSSRGSAEGLPERSANRNKSLVGWQWASEKAAAWLAEREGNDEATLRHGDAA